MLRTFEFGKPDKIPVVYHPSTAGLHVHGQKLLDLFRAFPPDNPIKFDQLPEPKPSTLVNGRYHEERTDEWGVVWEYLVYGIQGQVKRHPLAEYKDFTSYSFPAVPPVDSPAATRYRQMIQEWKKDYLVIRGEISLFEKFQTLHPMEEVLMEMYERDEEFLMVLDQLTDRMEAEVDFQIQSGVDVIQFMDDWGLQERPMISLELFREIYRPRYKHLFDRVHHAGRKVFFHSCGFLGPILEELIDLGIDGIWHQANRYDMKQFALKCREHNIAAYLHPDRQYLVPFGKPSQIREKIREYAETYHALGGGGIFYIEIENDAPWENVEALIRAVHEHR